MRRNVVISSSGLNLVKSYYRYVELMNTMRPLAFEVFLSLTQVFEFYVFCVFHLFTSREKRSRIYDDDPAVAALVSATSAGQTVTEERVEAAYESYLFGLKYGNLKNGIIKIRDYLESLADQQNYERSNVEFGGDALERIIPFSSLRTWGKEIGLGSCAKAIVAVESVFFIYDSLYRLKGSILSGEVAPSQPLTGPASADLRLRRQLNVSKS